MSKLVSLNQFYHFAQYNRIWNTGSKDEKKNLKLKVDFVYPDSVEVPSEPKRSVSENVEILRNKITKESNLDQRDDTSSQMPPENMFAELKNLRTKYDSVVEYTVRLTAERDMMVQRLEGIEKELTIARKKANQSDSANIGMKSDKLKKKSFTKVRKP